MIYELLTSINCNHEHLIEVMFITFTFILEKAYKNYHKFNFPVLNSGTVTVLFDILMTKISLEQISCSFYGMTQL